MRYAADTARAVHIAAYTDWPSPVVSEASVAGTVGCTAGPPGNSAEDVHRWLELLPSGFAAAVAGVSSEDCPGGLGSAALVLVGFEIVVAAAVAPFAFEQTARAPIEPDMPGDSAAGSAGSAAERAAASGVADVIECSAEHAHWPATEKSAEA